MAQHSRPLSIRRSLVVWIAFAIVGWTAAVVLLYGVFRFGLL
jgi:hypothetical protein